MGIYDILINRYCYTILYMYVKFLFFCHYTKKNKKLLNKFANLKDCVSIIV